MSIGSLLRCAQTGANIPQKFLSLSLALVLAISLVPGVAWAHGVDSAAGSSSTESVGATSPSKDQVVDALLSDKTPDSATDGSPADDAIISAPGENGAESLQSDGLEGDSPEVKAEGSLSAPPNGPAADSSTQETSPLDPAALALEKSQPDAAPSIPAAAQLSGAVTIYATSLSNGTSSTFVFSVGDTVVAQAKEKGTSGFIETDKLNYQWRVSSDGSTFVDIAGQTDSKLMLDDSYLGKYVRCVISSKIGTSSVTTKPTKAIGGTGAVNVTSVKVNKSGNLYPGDTVVATALAGSDDVTANEKVVWSWYRGNTAGNVTTRIEGASSYTLAVTDDMIGCYLQIRANGGFGDVKSSTLDPVVQKGAFTLYKVEASGSAEVGKTLTALAYGEDDPSVPVSENAIVTYQWQYASTNTTLDSAFTDIAGATGKTYTIPGNMLTRYLRVKATSLNASVSTTKPYYGSTQSVDPLGPVTLAGAYNLSSVKLTSSGQGMQAGNTITPTAQYKKGYSESDIPADAKVTYSWSICDTEDGSYKPQDEGVSATGALVLDASFVGKWVKVSANALINDMPSKSYRVLAAGEYDLLRVILSPYSGDIFTGDSIEARAQAKNLKSLTSGDPITGGVAYTWLVGESATGAFEPLSAADASLPIPPEAAGKYLKVRVTSGSSSVEAVTLSPVIGSDSLEAAAKKLKKLSFRPTLVDGADTNVNALIEAELVALGYDDVVVSTKSAEPQATDPKAEGAISCENDKTNGFVTSFYVDPDEKTGSTSYSTLRQIGLTFELKKEGETYDTGPVYKPSVTLPWNEGKVATLLKTKSSSFNLGFAVGDASDSVTKNLILPYKMADKSWSEVKWTSSDESVVKVEGSGWDDYSGKVTRTANDRTVTLSATVGIITSGGPDTKVTKNFDVTVKGDPQKVEAAKADLKKKVEAAYTLEAIVSAQTGEVVDADAITGDLLLPAPRKIGVDGKYFSVTYTASSDALVVNGYRGSVYQSLPGEASRVVDVTAVITDKSNAEITAAKSLSFTIAPMAQKDIDQEVSLMEAAKAGYFAAIANGQEMGAVTRDLHAFKKASFDKGGALVWAYDNIASSKAGDGIVPIDLEGFDPMGSAGWLFFKSSNPNVVKHENLLVRPQTYHTAVTVSSCLASEKYARYAARYPENSLFQKLAKQNVSATFTVRGTSSSEDPHVATTASVIGIDANGRDQTWAAALPYVLDAGATAADLSEKLFRQTGLVCDSGVGEHGWYLNTITSPFDAGQKLGWNSVTGKYWQLFINGSAAATGASGYVLQPDDRVTWYYSAWGASAPTDKLSVTSSVIGADAAGKTQTWAADATYVMDADSTAANLSEKLFASTGLVCDSGVGEYGWYLNTITSPYDKRQTLGWDSATGKFWQLFINGESASVGASGYTLKAGDSVTWCYSAYGDSLPDSGTIVIDPTAPRPSYDSSWSGSAGSVPGGSVVVNRPTPVQAAVQSWSYDIREGGTGLASASDPLLVNGAIYLVVSGELRVIDSASGKIKMHNGRELRAKVGSASAYLNRPVYAHGLIIVPSDNGSLAAFTADTLTCVWKTAALATEGSKLGYQSLSSLTINNGCVFAAFTMVGAGGIGTRGTLVCVDLSDGSVKWQKTDAATSEGAASGYYWAGAAAAGVDIVIGDEAGRVNLVDGATGEVKSSVSVGASVRSGIISVPVNTRAAATPTEFLAVSSDGVLHTIERTGDTLKQTNSLKFASKSTSTPAVSNGRAFVCSVDSEGYGTLVVINLSTMTVERTVRGGKGEAQSTPLVSVQGSSTYAYFTCNGLPGGVYGYRLGDESAYTLFTPDAASQQYGTASVIADEFGNLYYANDSGSLFALKGQEGVKVTFEQQGGSFVASCYVALGTALVRPADPVRAGYDFAGWFVDEAATIAWDFSRPVTQTLVLYAKWSKRTSGSGGLGDGGELPGDRPSDLPVQRPLGTVAAANAPVSPSAPTAPAPAAADPKASSAEVATAKDAGAVARSGGVPTSISNTEGVDGVGADGAPVNPWAVGGIAFGVVGLVCAAVYVARARRGLNGQKKEGGR